MILIPHHFSEAESYIRDKCRIAAIRVFPVEIALNSALKINLIEPFFRKNNVAKDRTESSLKSRSTVDTPAV